MAARARLAATSLLTALALLLGAGASIDATVSSLGRGVASAQDAPLVTGTFDAMRGGTRTLEEERGRRVVVLFYEDRNFLEVNDTLKGELRRFVDDNQLGERVVLYGVANLGDVGMVPEMMVRRMIAPLVERWGSDILLDWRGTLRQAPLSFATNAANVAIIDRAGRVVWQHVGAVDGTTKRDFYRALRGSLGPR